MQEERRLAHRLLVPSGDNVVVSPPSDTDDGSTPVAPAIVRMGKVERIVNHKVRVIFSDDNGAQRHMTSAVDDPGSRRPLKEEEYGSQNSIPLNSVLRLVDLAAC